MNKRPSILLLLFPFLFACSEQNFQTISSLQAESAQATYNNQVDVLWVIDNSSTKMENHQNRIAGFMENFHRGLLNSETDFHVAATTMDISENGEKGNLVESGLVVKQNTKGAVSKLQALIQRGGYGNNWEAGLTAMKEALEKAPRSFLRKNALLVIVFITDDKDTSRRSCIRLYKLLR